MTARVAYKTCNLCEAMCGLRLHVDGDRVVRVEGDPDDPLSRGHLCPKAVALGQLREDPDRLKRPMRRTGDTWTEISWAEAFEEAATRIAAIQREHGDDAVASYLGNPGAHDFGIVMYLVPLYRVLATRNRYSASSLDQNPKHAAGIMLWGNYLRIAVPDVDRTDFLLVLGANPVVSGGSLMTAPGFKRRARALRDRGGRLVVVDPRRTETAKLADEHVAIAPGHDAWLLASLLHVVFDEGLGRTRGGVHFADGLGELERALAPFAPEAVGDAIGVAPGRIRGLARDFAGAERAVCYARIGTCTQQHGTLATWLVDALNLVTGNLDHEGGAMFTHPAVDLAGIAAMRGSTGEMNDARTRVRGAPAFNDERPSACLAEEITTPGEGRVRGLVTVAGNPASSVPNAPALDAALGELDFHVAIDFYMTETTRHADLILPPTASLEDMNYEVLFHGFAVRNTAKLSPAVLSAADDARHDWQILLQLATRIGEKKSRGRKKLGWRLARLCAGVAKPERILDWAMRLGPHGDGFRPWRRGLRRRDLEAAPSGLDLGPLRPALPDALDTEDQRIDLAHPLMLSALADLAATAPPRREGDALWLIGRREVRTNNSWLHNVEMSAKGPDRCTLWMHPDDAAKRGLAAGDAVRVSSRAGAVEAPLELRDELMPGVVSVPHGWGHDRPGMRMHRATARPGVNCNVLTDDAVLEPIVGNAVYTGVPVRVERAANASDDEGDRR